MTHLKTSVFDCLGADGFELCHPDETKDFETVANLVTGEPRSSSWTPLAVHLVNLDEGQKLRRSDAPWFGGHAIVLGERAAGAMGSLLTDGGELLPLRCGDRKLWMFNPTVLLDALDVEASRLMRFDDGRIMYIQRPVFRTDLVRGVPVFKLAGLPKARTFFGSAFVDCWQKAGLTGLEFRKVWSG